MLRIIGNSIVDNPPLYFREAGDRFIVTNMAEDARIWFLCMNAASWCVETMKVIPHKDAYFKILSSSK